MLLCFLQLVQDIARLRRRSLRHSRQLDFPKPYIAARFRSLPSHFILGDMKHYDNFENRALEPGQKYVLFILAVLQEPEAVSAPEPRSCHSPAALLPSPSACPAQLWGFWMCLLCLVSCYLCLHQGHEQLPLSQSLWTELVHSWLQTGARMGRN